MDISDFFRNIRTLGFDSPSFVCLCVDVVNTYKFNTKLDINYQDPGIQPTLLCALVC